MSVPHAVAFNNIVFADHPHLKQELLAFTTTPHLYSPRLSLTPLKCTPQSDFLVSQVCIKYKTLVVLNTQFASLDTTPLSIALGNQGQKLPLVRPPIP